MTGQSHLQENLGDSLTIIEPKHCLSENNQNTNIALLTIIAKIEGQRRRRRKEEEEEEKRKKKKMNNKKEQKLKEQEQKQEGK